MRIPKTFHLMDPGLRGVGGHYFSLNTAIARELAHLGVRVNIYGGIGATLPPNDFNFLELFRLEVFQELSGSDPESHIQKNFLDINKIYLDDLSRISTESFDKNDLIFFQGITQNQVEAICEWLEKLPEVNRPPVIIMLRFLNSRMLHNVQRGYTKEIEFLYDSSLRKLVRRHPDTRLVSDTRELCDIFSLMTGLPVTLLPSPLSGQFEEHGICPAAPQHDSVNILYIGNSSPYKGVFLLPEIVDQTLSKHDTLNFTIHLSGKAEVELKETFEVLRAKYSSRLRLLIGTLDMAEYLSEISRSDMVLLPYHPVYYSFGSSGIFIEASGMGKIVIVTKGTVADGITREYDLPVLFADEFKAQSYVCAIGEALSNLSYLRKNALLVSSFFSEIHSPRNFFRVLFGLI